MAGPEDKCAISSYLYQHGLGLDARRHLRATAILPRLSENEHLSELFQNPAHAGSDDAHQPPEDFDCLASAEPTWFGLRDS